MEQKVKAQRILILDDDGDFRKLLTTFLGSILSGAEIIEYDPVAQGLPGADYDWASIDLLILDYDLHGTGATGIDILQANSNNRLFPATIILTGAGGEDVAVRALRAGVYDYLRKQGLKKEQLKSSVMGVMARHAANRDRLYSLEEARQLLSKEAELIIAACRTKYEQLLQQEAERFKAERAKLETDLQNHQARLNEIESEKGAAEESLGRLQQEQQKLKEKLDAGHDRGKATAQQSLKTALKDTAAKLEQTHQKLESTMSERDKVKAEVDRMKWQREQDKSRQEQFQNDLQEFESDIKVQQEQYDKLAQRLARSAKIKQEAAELRKSQNRAHDQDLLKDIGSQLGKDDK